MLKCALLNVACSYEFKGLKIVCHPVLKETMIHRALESDSIPFRLVMRINEIFDEICSSVKSRDSDRGYFAQPSFKENL